MASSEAPQAAAALKADDKDVDPKLVGFYMQTFGRIVQKYNLGGSIPLSKLNLKDNKDSDGVDLSVEAQRKGHIEKSRMAKEYYFTEQKRGKLE